MESRDGSPDISSKGQDSNRRPDQPPTDPSNSNHFVVFADMLGFAALIGANPIDVRIPRASSRPGSLDLESIISKPKNPLTEAFSSFQLHVKWGAEISHAVTAITFSDSVFFATTSLVAAATFAAKLAHAMLASRVPVRMGIASGSFAALRFRSDVSTDGGDHAAEFLGTAVVRAYQTERCGIKGLRVLVHPSMEPLLVNGSPTDRPSASGKGGSYRFLEVHSIELTNVAQVRYELDNWSCGVMEGIIGSAGSQEPDQEHK